MSTEYRTQVEEAMSRSSLVKCMGEHISARTQAMRHDQRDLMLQLSKKYDDNKYADMSGAHLQKLLLSYLDKEIECMRSFDHERQAPGARLPIQVSTHKMSFILSKVRTEFASEQDGNRSLDDIASGKPISDPSWEAKWPILRSDSYWGSNKGTIESAKMICFQLATTDQTIADFADKSIAHVTPTSHLPPGFKASGSKFLTQVNAAGAHVHGFGFIHGGYAFGGQRDEAKQFVFGPEDCSSMLHNCMQAVDREMPYGSVPIQSHLSTLDLLYTWRKQQKQGSFFISKTNWSEYLDARLEATSFINVGNIYLLRTFLCPDACPDSHGRGGGHTGLVLGDDPADSTRMLIFECARDMELEDPTAKIWGCAGAGIGSFPKVYEEIRNNKIYRTMFLKPLAAH